MSLVTRSELEKLKSVVLFFLAQREMRRPVGRLLSTIKDIRHIMFRIVKNDLLPVPSTNDSELFEEINLFLEDLHEELLDEISDVEYAEYVIDQIASSFESALKIKGMPSKTLRFKNIVEDLPILKPFDLNLKPYLIA